MSRTLRLAVAAATATAVTALLSMPPEDNPSGHGWHGWPLALAWAATFIGTLRAIVRIIDYP